MICRLVPSSQGAFVYPVPVSELFKRLLISAWRAKMDAMKPNKQRANSKKLYLNSPADTSKQCWTLELQLSRRCRRSPTNVVETHMRLCTVYICVAWKVESGGTLNDPSNLFFLPPETRLVGVKKKQKTPELLQRLFQHNLIGRIVLLLSPDRYHSSWVITPLTVYQWDGTSLPGLIIQLDGCQACSNI